MLKNGENNYACYPWRNINIVMLLILRAVKEWLILNLVKKPSGKRLHWFYVYYSAWLKPE